MRDATRKEELIVDKHGKQWINCNYDDDHNVDGFRRSTRVSGRSGKSRALEGDEEIVVPFEVRKLLPRCGDNSVEADIEEAEASRKRIDQPKMSVRRWKRRGSKEGDLLVRS